MDLVFESLRRCEGRLQRLLASGWRNAAHEARALLAEADALEGLGLEELAHRLRTVGGAATVGEALGAVSLALSAIRLLRSQLLSFDPPPGGWDVLEARVRRSSPAHDRVVPIGRMALGGDEVWACARLRGRGVDDWMLVEPLESAPAEPWLLHQVQGRLIWRGRYPLGASGEVQRCSLAEPTWLERPEPKDDPFAGFREALKAGRLQDGMAVANDWGPFKLKLLEAADAESCVWADPSGEEAYRQAAVDRVWILAWVTERTLAPLGVVSPGGLFRKARLVHLAPGNPWVQLPS